MKIVPKICLTKQQDEIPCICLKTGIASALVVPQLPKGPKGETFVFEYIHPLSYWSNAQGLIKAGRNYFEQLESQVLAGLIITTLEHYGLLDKYELNAVEANAILCTASNDTLVELLSLCALITDKNSLGTPSLVLEWHDIQYAQTIDSQLLQYIKTLRAEFISPVKDEDTSQRKIQILNAAAASNRSFKNGVTLLSAKASLASFEKDFEVQFKSAKREIKGLLQTMLDNGTPRKMVLFLETVMQGRNLVAMDSELRTNLQARLNGLNTVAASRIATLVGECNNPYDIFAKASEALDRASDDFTKPAKPKSLKEILAAKKLAAKGHTGSVADEALDEEVEDLLDYVPEEASEELTEEEDGLEDVYSRMTKSIYDSKEF